jgi:L-ribulose-5-phosphate 3-epimerase
MDSSIRFGIVQGRLIQSPPGCLQWFPQEQWQDEFKIASDLGIDYIELIAEVQHNENNPIWSEDGIEEIKHLVEKNNLTLHALCNDYIVEHKLLEECVVEQNIKLLKQAEKLNVEKYIMPLFESSELNIDNMEEYIDPIRKIAKCANDKGITTCLETILTGEELIKLLDMIDRPYVKAVYDTGNRVAFGHDLSGDIRLLGNKISHVHIKDKDNKNSNVLLGTGLVNFSEVFKAFKDIQYNGPFTFETTRGADPLKTAIYNMNVVDFFKQDAEPHV